MRIKIGLVALALVSGATNVRSQVFEPAEAQFFYKFS
jgi:hypothetical protein